MPRKKLADPVTLRVVFEPDDGGWHVHVPSLQGCRSWGRSLSEARRNIREAISLCEEELGDADAVARDAILEEDIQLDPGLRRLLEQLELVKAKAEAEVAAAKALTAIVAEQLTKDLSLRDAGELLGLSQEGVRKALKARNDLVHAREPGLEMILKKKGFTSLNVKTGRVTSDKAMSKPRPSLARTAHAARKG
jgi:predicted RNase H-like HicB family nuclease